MISYDTLALLAGKSGFSAWSPLDPGSIVCRKEVRDACAQNACGQYGKRWSCPPGCGSLEECARRIKGCTYGILVQTIGELEDEFDGEAMMETEALHKAHFLNMFSALRERNGHILALGAGCCTRCTVCSYPDAPCRFPEEVVSSMEAYGMLVLQVCRDNGLTYYYGSHKIAYTGCFLL
ncbi:MAG: DUF2284 domain-containing protein [Oscillospiraceae bacterium]|nr:DUF2284 domain-containing protein [Oscillospiraceae bacterium]